MLYADGGWQRSIDRLAERLRTRGGHILVGGAVESLAPASDGGGGPWTVTRAAGPGSAGATILAGSVMLAGLSPAAAVRLSGSAELARRCDVVVPATAAALDVGLRRLPRPRHPFALGLDRPWYLSVHNPPADLGSGVTLHVMAYLDRHDAATPSEPGTPVETPDGAGRARALRDELEGLLDQVQPGWRLELETARFQRRLVVAHALPTVSGGGLAERPPVVVADRPGLFLAGDWVGPVGLLADATIASAAAAAAAAATGAHPSPIRCPLTSPAVVEDTSSPQPGRMGV